MVLFFTVKGKNNTFENLTFEFAHYKIKPANNHMIELYQNSYFFLKFLMKFEQNQEAKGFRVHFSERQG